MTERQFLMLDVLAMSCAIQRHRGKYVNVHQVIGGEIQEHTNKDILFFYLVPGTSPENFVPDIKLTPEDRQQANDIIKFYRRLTFGVLADDLNNYKESIARILGTNDCTTKDFGILASLPSAYLRDSDRNRKERLIKEAEDGVFGNEGDSVEMFCHLVDIRFVDSIQCYSHTAINAQGYLIEFLNKKQLGFEGDDIKIKGKVRNHGEHFYTHKALTRLNYVKIV